MPGAELFSKAAATLVTWLDRGDCSKRNIGSFYSMIQSSNSQVRRLIAEKMQYEDELSKFKEQTRGRMQGILGQCEFRHSSSSAYKLCCEARRSPGSSDSTRWSCYSLSR